MPATLSRATVLAVDNRRRVRHYHNRRGSNGTQVQGTSSARPSAALPRRPNGGNGVVIIGAPNNTIGGTSAGARNIISGKRRPRRR
jgi:hypothetical protein